MLRGYLYLIGAGVAAIRRAQLSRSTTNVSEEYTQGWKQYASWLERVKSLEEWLFIRGLEDAPRFQSVSGRLNYGVFDPGAFYRERVLNAIRAHFSEARSITEYGCGIGRNLLFLKQHAPELDCYGYELTQAGVEVATAAAAKFGLSVSFRQLDFARDAPSRFVFPVTDLAFTMFSLEQLPRDNREALSRILDRVRLGSVHLEPVPENYPWNYRGIIGRIDHMKADYLRDLDANTRTFSSLDVSRAVFDTSHNPLMFPSLYVLKKRSA